MMTLMRRTTCEATSLLAILRVPRPPSHLLCLAQRLGMGRLAGPTSRIKHRSSLPSPVVKPAVPYPINARVDLWLWFRFTDSVRIRAVVPLLASPSASTHLIVCTLLPTIRFPHDETQKANVSVCCLYAVYVHSIIS